MKHFAARSRARRLSVALAASALTAATAVAVSPAASAATADPATTTPVKHVVVIFDENISFDHYFGTYPKAANTDGTAFTAAPGTPAATNLLSNNSQLLVHNPNQYQPRRLGPAEALTCDQNHSYGPEEGAFDNGKMDQFVQRTSSDTCSGLYGSPGLTMDYFDGNTVTGLWNYAQNYAMSDNSFGDQFGPSTPGALNLIAGQTHGGISINATTGQQVAPGASSTVGSPDPVTGVGTVFGDSDPAYDDCADNNHTSTSLLTGMQGKNIGDLLNDKGVTWGWFQGGFAPTSSSNGQAVCGATHSNVSGAASPNYVPHHEPFQYYKSTANPHHLPPTSTAMIGHQDQANHQYDLSSFDAALSAGNLPAVSFLKGSQYQDGHAATSDPLDEQAFLTSKINEIEKSPDWASTAVVVAYDDSDGWYDQVAAEIGNGSKDTGAGDTAMCTSGPAPAGGYADRCGPGPRLPLLVISPFSKQNYIDHTLTTQSSVLRFIEDNWSTGQIGDSSFDATAGSLDGMFDFAKPQQREVLLAPSGAVALTVPIKVAAAQPAGQSAAGQSPAETSDAVKSGVAQTGSGSAGSGVGSGSGSGQAPQVSGGSSQAAGQSQTATGLDGAASGAAGPAKLSAAEITGVSVPAALLLGGGLTWLLVRRRRPAGTRGPSR